MATGDIKNNLRKLKSELRKAHYFDPLDLKNMVVGVTTAWLPILHYVFTDYSVELASYFSSKGYEFYGKSDLRFLETIYKILIQEFEVKPMLTKEQFFTIGFAEVKVIFVTKIVTLCLKKNDEIISKMEKKKPSRSKGVSKQNKGKMLQTTQSRTTDNVRHHSEVDLSSNESILRNENESQDIEYEYQRLPLLPLPNPDLALTPIKPLRKAQKCMKNNVVNQIHNVSILDITEFDEGEDCASIIEIKDDKEEESLPLFKVTKHTEVDFDVITPNNVGCGVDKTLMQNFAPKMQLPKEVKIYCDSKPTDVQGNCLCESTSGAVKKLTERLEVMERNFHDLINVNSDLSTKLILMETKVKLMESSFKQQLDQQQKQREQHHQQQKQEEQLQQRGRQQQNCLIGSHAEEPRTAAVGFECYQKPSKYIRDEQALQDQEKQYSPVKYTDDDVITKDFRPMRMGDVRNLLMDDNKENKPELNTKFTSGRRQHMDVNVDEDSVLHDSLNVSNMLGGTTTKQTVRNVKQQLMETDRLLRNGTTHLIY